MNGLVKSVGLQWTPGRTLAQGEDRQGGSNMNTRQLVEMLERERERE